MTHSLSRLTRRIAATLFAAMALLPLADATRAQGARPSSGASSAASSLFVIGVLPNVSARVIAMHYQPMQDYFQRELEQKVEIATATDFRAFHENTMKGAYHAVVTAANLGRVSQVDGKWSPVAIYEPAIPGLLVTGAGNTEGSPAQLKGKALAVANPQSLVVLRGLQWLGEQGLQAGRDFRLVRAGNEDSLAPLIRSGEAPMAMMSMGEFRSIGESLRKELRIAAEFARVPGFLVLVNPSLPAAARDRVAGLMARFAASEEGKRFFALSGFSSIRALRPGELEPLDAFVAQTRAGLAPQN